MNEESVTKNIMSDTPTNDNHDDPIMDIDTPEDDVFGDVAAGATDPLEMLRAELDEARAATLYAQAEIQNMRRRSEKEVADAHAYSATRFARDILSVADNISRALDAISPAMRADDGHKGLVIGLEATQREMKSVLERNGISQIEAMGQLLDPNKHQAMLELPSDQPPGTIVQEMQPGYMIKDRLLRPAMVAVAKAAVA
jgi:molecular chaperone GrpE